jgi:hypothetical protein
MLNSDADVAAFCDEAVVSKAAKVEMGYSNF